MKHWKTSLLKPSIPFAVKKRPDVNSIFGYLNKELHNSNVTSTLIDTSLRTLTIDEKLEIKYPYALESCKSKTPTSLSSLPTPLNYKTPIIESNKDTVRDTFSALEEKVNLLNIEIIAMKSFIEDQMLILRQSTKDSTLQKSSCDHNSKIARLTEEITYLRNEKRTKSCIIQTLLEDDNTQQKPPVPNKSDFKVPNKYVRSSENHSANNTYISTSNR